MTTAYITEAEGETYFGERLNADAWDDASSSDRVKATKQATKAIDRLNFRGEKTSSTQANQFPRGDDTAVPQDIKDACAECALAFLDGLDPEIEYENLSMVSQGYANVRSSYDRSGVPIHVVAGIPSSVAWRFLVPYLRDIFEADLRRIS